MREDEKFNSRVFTELNEGNSIVFPPFVPPDKYSIVIDSGFFAPNKSSEQDRHVKSVVMIKRIDMAIDDFFIIFPS